MTVFADLIIFIPRESLFYVVDVVIQRFHKRFQQAAMQFRLVSGRLDQYVEIDCTLRGLIPVRDIGIGDPGFSRRPFVERDTQILQFHRFWNYVVDTDSDAIYDFEAGQNHIDLAVRYSHYVGNWDFGVYAFEGTGREPRLQFDLDRGRTIPIYDVIRQAGGDVQYTRGAWLGKLETIVRSGNGDTFAAAVGGVEYTLFQALGAADIGVLVEYLYDGRDDEAPFTPFDDDVFVGSRLAWNDTRDTALLVGAIIVLIFCLISLVF